MRKQDIVVDRRTWVGVLCFGMTNQAYIIHYPRQNWDTNLAQGKIYEIALEKGSSLDPNSISFEILREARDRLFWMGLTKVCNAVPYTTNPYLILEYTKA